MRDDCKKELMSLSHFLRQHKNVNDVSVDVKGDDIILTIDKLKDDDAEWQIIETVFNDHFQRRYNSKLVFDFGDKWELDVPAGKNLEAGESQKQILNKIVIYGTARSDWRLFRYFTKVTDLPDNNYFMPSRQIAAMEVSNLDRTFAYAAKDMATRKFVRNVIELNINCLIEENLRNDYIFAFKQLPKQLKNRFAISLVRISKDVTAYELKQAASICRMCTDNIFLSFAYTHIPHKETLRMMHGVTGFVVTVNSDAYHTVHDVKKIYEVVNNCFSGKSVFLLFDDKKISEQIYANKNIKLFYKNEQFEVEPVQETPVT